MDKLDNDMVKAILSSDDGKSLLAAKAEIAGKSTSASNTPAQLAAYKKASEKGKNKLAETIEKTLEQVRTTLFMFGPQSVEESNVRLFFTALDVRTVSGKAWGRPGPGQIASPGAARTVDYFPRGRYSQCVSLLTRKPCLQAQSRKRPRSEAAGEGDGASK